MPTSYVDVVATTSQPANGANTPHRDTTQREHLSGWREFTARHLPIFHFGLDALVWVGAIVLGTLLRLDFDLERTLNLELHSALALAMALQGLFGTLTGLYRRRWRFGSFDEVVALSSTTLLTGITLTLVNAAGDPSLLPVSIPPMAMFLTMCGTVAARSAWRLARARAKRPSEGEPILIVGAGAGAEGIIHTLLGDPTSPYLPVALVDDDPRKANRRVQGVRHEGTIADITAVAAHREIRTVLLAIPSADSELIRRVHDECRRGDLQLLVLPRTRDVLGSPSMADIRPVTINDLLGRKPAEIDPDAVAGYVTGRRVLVTGAGGSIGSELARQLACLAPAELMLLDRDESGLHGTQLSIEGRALLDDPNLILADIRDRDRLLEIFVDRRPDVVFHAAALKHLTLLEGAPGEAWKTNVVGTQNVLDAASAAGVTHFVNISTDKAADPISVLGYSKRLTERLTAQRAHDAVGRYVSVRFGNVMGSRGSVLNTFRSQADNGGPITVTHPDVTRYFMTVEEAVRLSIYAGAIGNSGDVLVLDMGEPVRIADVAARFANQYTPARDIVFTGLRPGEKLHEDLFGLDETDRTPVHALIEGVPVPPLRFDLAEEVAFRTGQVTTVALALATRIDLSPERLLEIG